MELASANFSMIKGESFTVMKSWSLEVRLSNLARMKDIEVCCILYTKSVWSDGTRTSQ